MQVSALDQNEAFFGKKLSQKTNPFAVLRANPQSAPESQSAPERWSFSSARPSDNKDFLSNLSEMRNAEKLKNDNDPRKEEPLRQQKDKKPSEDIRAEKPETQKSEPKSETNQQEDFAASKENSALTESSAQQASQNAEGAAQEQNTAQLVGTETDISALLTPQETSLVLESSADTLSTGLISAQTATAQSSPQTLIAQASPEALTGVSSEALTGVSPEALTSLVAQQTKTTNQTGEQQTLNLEQSEALAVESLTEGTPLFEKPQGAATPSFQGVENAQALKGQAQPLETLPTHEKRDISTQALLQSPQNTPDAKVHEKHTQQVTSTLRDIPVVISKALTSKTEKLTIEITPPELGKVDVRLEYSKDGTVKAVVSAERIETFYLLKQDHARFLETLQNAGFDRQSTDLSFEHQGQQHSDHRENPSSKGEATFGTEFAYKDEKVSAITRTRLSGLDVII